MKLNLSKFKKTHEDDHFTTLKHEDGHEFKVAHGSLGPEYRKSLKKLPIDKKMAEGGEVAGKRYDPYNPIKKENTGPYVNEDKAKKLQKGFASVFAKGGKVEAEELDVPVKNDSQLDIESLPEPIARKPASAVEYEEIEPKKYAEGTPDAPIPPESREIPYEKLLPKEEEQMAAKAPAPVVVNVGTPPPASPPAAAPAPQAAAPQPEGLAPQQAPQSPPPAAPKAEAPAQDPYGAGASQEALNTGLQQQMAGADLATKATAQAAKEQAGLHQQAADYANQQLQMAQKHYADYTAEADKIKANMKDIDPKHVWANTSIPGKIGTVIGLVLSGIGSAVAHQDNAALKMMNSEIERDMDAQRANLGKQENLLGALQNHYKSDVEAQNMFGVIKRNQIADMIDRSAALSKSPQAQAAAMQFKGKLLAENAQTLGQMAARKTALGQTGQVAADGQPSQQDPARLIPVLVPKEERENVFKEVERAENTMKIASGVMKNFDATAGQLKSAGGLGRVAGKVYPAPQKAALMEQLGATVSDQVGTVRDAAMKLAEHAYVPEPGDTDERIATKREQLAHYLQLKSASPRAKSYGIDLDKFAGTARNNIGADPREAEFLKWAKANPNNPKAAAIFKKLGVK